MFDFEKALVGSIPLEEAASFFVSVKSGSAQVKVAAAQTRAQQVFEDLLSGKTIEGKAGHFKTAEVKTAKQIPPASEYVKREALRAAEEPPHMHERLRAPLGFLGGAALGGIGTTALLAPYMRKSLTKELIGGAGIGLGTFAGAGLGTAAGIHSMPKFRQMRLMQGLENEIKDPDVRAEYLRQIGQSPDSEKMAEKLEKTDADLREEGRKSGVKALAAESAREKGRRGERVGETIGRAVGTGAGFIGARHLGKAGVVPSLASAALGYGIGGKAGKEIGTELDIKKNASVLRRALEKLAWEGEMGSAGQMPAPPQAEAAYTSEGPAGPTPQEPVAVPQTMPVNYLGAERMARKAQEASESKFLRERLVQSRQANQGLQEQSTQAQQQMTDMQNQLAGIGVQVQTAQQEALAANDRAVQHSQAAANLRIAVQQMREQMFQLASQEPESPQTAATGNAEQQQQAEQQQSQQAEQKAQNGTPEGSPEPGGGAPPGSAPEGAGTGYEGKEAPAKSTTEVTTKETTEPSSKLSSVSSEVLHRLPYAAGGAALGGAAGYTAQMRGGALRKKVEEMEQRAPSTFSEALDLAKAKKELAEAEAAEKHPVAATLAGAGAGAGAGAVLGPQLAKLIQNIRVARSI